MPKQWCIWLAVFAAVVLIVRAQVRAQARQVALDLRFFEAEKRYSQGGREGQGTSHA